MNKNIEEIRAYAKNRAKITYQLKDVLVDRLMLQKEPNEIPEDCLLFSSGLGLDSVDALEVVVAVETEFEITIRDDDRSFIRAVNSIVDLIMDRKDSNA